jgi:hypothetical protein
VLVAVLLLQVEDLESRLRLREEEVEGLRSKVAELKAGRAELYQKLYDSTASRTTEVGAWKGMGERSKGEATVGLEPAVVPFGTCLHRSSGW